MCCGAEEGSLVSTTREHREPPARAVVKLSGYKSKTEKLKLEAFKEPFFLEQQGVACPTLNIFEYTRLPELCTFKWLEYTS